MWIDIDGDGTRFLNSDKVAMIVIGDDNSFAIYGNLNGTDCNFFSGVDVNGIIEQLRGTDNGRTENN